ncbi:hypothetical protein PAEH1_02410 [Paenalcaligenes hominis]|uniref:LysM domain-containing protein n=1 Tax=Paenalcaligenes hominis TaxID=643674 RepID=A0A1U9JXZ5_9BURK|nr:FimV/HubP family polar landmark protein [Paenalcaligenes hominis]AQS50683.1 hypothetical protein PAEH1_02410 [Paenalcaligenes hominis]
MTTHCRPARAILWSAGAAAVLGALSTQAAVLGHSRVTSLPQQPLRISVLIKDLSPAEQASLTARIAPSAAWQEAGLSAPVDLATFRLKTLPATQANTVQLLLESSQSTEATVIDVLVDIQTDSSTQRHQVSVLQAPQPTPVALAQTRAIASAPQSTAAAPASTAVAAKATAPVAPTYRVRSGQSLSRIARHYRSDEYSQHQFMAAVLEANPHAFIHGNLHLIRAGATLTIPDAQQIAAVSTQQASQLYQTHLQWFDDYRQRLAQGLPIEPMSASTASAPVDPQLSADQSHTDRLQLATDDPSTVEADQKTAVAQELAYSAERLAQLEGTAGSTDAAQAQTDQNQTTDANADKASATATSPSTANPNQAGSVQASPLQGIRIQRNPLRVGCLRCGLVPRLCWCCLL